MAEAERSASISALIARAEELYEQRRYHEALTLCKGLAARGHQVAVMEMIREGCEGAVRRRRALRVAVAAALLLIPLGLAFLYYELTRVRLTPPPGALRVQELQSQPFAVTAWSGGLRRLEYQWTLFDADGRPAPPREQSCLRQDEQSPWKCVYKPAYDLVKGAAGEESVTRRLVVRGVSLSGRQVVRAEWAIEAADKPLPPTIPSLSVEPPSHEPACIPAGEARTFRVEATDGDGGKALKYVWLLDQDETPVSTGPTWTYKPDYAALASRQPGQPVVQSVFCHVSNRLGLPLTQTVKWTVRVVASNVAPAITQVEPELPNLTRVKARAKLRLTAKAFDPDKDDRLKFQWTADGMRATVSPQDPASVNQSVCDLRMPEKAPPDGKELLLRLTVTDSCGAKAERTWRFIVEDAPDQ